MKGLNQMGSRFLFRCPNCSYEAKVDGDYSRGFERYQVTIECLDCADVLDVEIDPVLWRENCRGGKLANPQVQCSVDPDHQAQTWDGCCPKCGEAMEKAAFIMDWD